MLKFDKDGKLIEETTPQLFQKGGEISNGSNAVIKGLNDLLANYQVFYQNLQGLHWNIEGILFFELHDKYEEMYNEAGEKADEIAERILALDGKPLHSFTDYLKISDIKELKDVADGGAGVTEVIKSFEIIYKKEAAIIVEADKIKDEATIALVSAYMIDVGKILWMLKKYNK